MFSLEIFLSVLAAILVWRGISAALHDILGTDMNAHLVTIINHLNAIQNRLEKP